MSDLNESFEAGEAEAVAAGMTVLTAADDQLFIDLDSEYAWQNFQRRYSMFKRHEQNGGPTLEVVDRYWSKSGPPHRHMVIHFWNDASDSTVEQRIMLQALLGSDPDKEFLTLLRHWQGVAQPIRLFKPADANDHDWDGLEAMLGPIDPWL